ncbi:MAG: tRNA (cmo5U34)-methyltransferase [Candidatus Hydrogenedentes bacterium ADurb.Bin179]|nr:MAG: tRNA (cmo5U34)-methyltransferase [Candidatus Hydrogenedentes bacterium ADurb.Bin179]
MRDKVKPDGKWVFDAEVADAFDDMLERSIPQYDVMRDACHALAMRYAKPRTVICDIGCSRGGAMERLVSALGAYNQHIGLEISHPMLEAARARFEGYIKCGVVDIREADLRTAIIPSNASVIMSVLTIQFVPIEYRQSILSRVYEALNPGGVLILVEKVLGISTGIDEAFTSVYYDMKRANGYNEEDIARKRAALEGVLVPVTEGMNREFMRAAGFVYIDTFWRWMNFAGWLAIKK